MAAYNWAEIIQVRVCLKNTHRAEKASFGTCLARLF